MSTKLSESELAEIREAMTSGDAELMYVTTSGDNMRALLDHCTALEEELKVAQEERDKLKSERDNLNQMNIVKNAINNFRAQLVEAVRGKKIGPAPSGFSSLWDEALQEAIELIQTFEAREVK